jgi:hypothetical protein
MPGGGFPHPSCSEQQHGQRPEAEGNRQQGGQQLFYPGCRPEQKPEWSEQGQGLFQILIYQQCLGNLKDLGSSFAETCIKASTC